MSETKVTCDKCQAIIMEGLTRFKVSAGPLRHDLAVIDLCKDCGPLLLDWLRAGPPLLQGHLAPAEARQ